MRTLHDGKAWDKLPLHHLDRVIETSRAGGPWRSVIYIGALYKGVTPDRHEEIDLYPEFERDRRR